MKKLGTVMVIDDDKVNNFICSKVITKSGVTDSIITFTSALDALDHIREAIADSSITLPDLILLDLNMPVMDGWGFLDEFKSLTDQLERKIEIIVLSSSIYHEDINKANAYPEVSEYRTKPINLDMLKDIHSKYFT